MDARRAMERLLEMSFDPDIDPAVFDAHLESAAMELLSALCTTLSVAAAVARGKSLRRLEGREQASECAAGICTVLEIWQSTAVEVIDGPDLEQSWLAAPLRN
ncbi:MAG: hypothetical protein AAGC55_08155 [Myxococcota bacterium]